MQRQVATTQTVNEEEVHESADDGGPNVLGRCNFADDKLFKQMRETCNSKERALVTEHRETEYSYQESGETRDGDQEHQSRPSRESPPSSAGIGKASMV